MISVNYVQGSVPSGTMISIQWDIYFYYYEWTRSDASGLTPIICPNAESRFWMSIYNPDETTSYTFGGSSFGWAVFDETDEGWGWDTICLEQGTLASSLYSTESNCSGIFSGHKNPTYIEVGGTYGDNNLMAFHLPRCYRRQCCDWAEEENGDEVYMLETIQGIYV